MVSHKLRLSFQPRGLAVSRGFILFSFEFQNLVVACVKTFYSQDFPSGCLSFHLRVSRFYTTCNPICCHIGRLLTLALELLPFTDITAINAIKPRLPTTFVLIAFCQFCYRKGSLSPTSYSCYSCKLRLSFQLFVFELARSLGYVIFSFEFQYLVVACVKTL